MCEREKCLHEKCATFLWANGIQAVSHAFCLLLSFRNLSTAKRWFCRCMMILGSAPLWKTCSAPWQQLALEMQSTLHCPGQLWQCYRLSVVTHRQITLNIYHNYSVVWSSFLFRQMNRCWWQLGRVLMLSQRYDAGYFAGSVIFIALRDFCREGMIRHIS